MTTIVGTPLTTVEALGIVCLMLLLWGVYLFVQLASLGLSRRMVGLGGGACVLLATFGTTLRGVTRKMSGRGKFCGELATWLADTPLAWSVALLVACAFVEAALTRQLLVHRRASVDADSVKEALDALPDAVLFLGADGHPLLQNARAMELGLGQRLAAESWDAKELQGKAGLQGEAGLLHDAQGRTWQLSRTRLELARGAVDELVATDVTEEYALLRELEQRVVRLGEVNARLREYSNDLARLTHDEEVLAAKMRVHDELGRALVALRAYELQEPKVRDRAGLLELWRRVLRLLVESGVEERETDDWELLTEAAEAIGVRLVLEGELPEAPGARKLAVSVAHECLNNAVRHGEAHEVCVTCAVAGGWVELSVANDGAVPAEPTAPQGGLGNLRAAVECAGGELTVAWAPQVVVHASFPEAGVLGQ